MANWKKVIVSGSNANLNHITASGDISASGFLFGNLPPGTRDEVVIYNPNTGRLEFKELNLINTSPAPNLFLIDTTGEHTTNFRLSHDTGNSNLISKGVFPYIQLSASIDGGSTYTRTSGSNVDYVTLNGEWSEKNPANLAYYTPSSDQTASFLSSTTIRDSLDVGQSSFIEKTFHFQAINNTNTAVPEYDTNAANLNYGNRAFRDGGKGILEFYVNDNDVPVRVFDLETNLAAVSADSSNGIEVNLFETQSNLDSTSGS